MWTSSRGKRTSWQLSSILYTWALLTQAGWTLEQKDFCPYSGNDPCHCSFSDTVTIVCRGVQSPLLSKMLLKFYNVTGRSTDHLIVERSDITVAQRDLLKTTPVQSVHFIDSNVDLSLLGDMLRTIRDRLTYLQLRKCRFVGPPSGWTLGNLPYMRRLAVTKSLLSTDRTAALLQSSWVNLEELYLYQNQIEQLQNWTLSHSKRLAVVNLNANKLKELFRSTFPDPATNLRELHLRENLLIKLPDDIFSQMPALRLVDLSGNGLTTLNENTWRPIWSQLSDIYLHKNPLQCDCNIMWVTEEEKILPHVTKFQRLLYGTCQTPVYIQNKHLETITFSDLPC